MRLVRLPANDAWAFTLGDAINSPLVRLDLDGRLLFPSREEAVAAAAEAGLSVGQRGQVAVTEASEAS